MSRSRGEGEGETPEDDKNISLSRRDSRDAIEGSDDSLDSDDEQPGRENKSGLSAEDLEKAITCPVTGYIFLRAVILIPMGYTVEKEYADYLLSHNSGYPQLNSEPKVSALIDNRAINNIVTAFLEKNPDRKSRQYVMRRNYAAIRYRQPIRRLFSLRGLFRHRHVRNIVRALRGDKKDDGPPRGGPGQGNQ